MQQRISRRIRAKVFLLAFVPMLHGTVRQVTSRYTSLTRDDVAQQTILIFLEFLESARFRRRVSHLAFALARQVKRRAHAWARQESARIDASTTELLSPGLDGNAFERLVVLRRLLDRASARAAIDAADLEMLIQIKIDGEPGEVFYEELGLTPNAFRQRVKRLLAKLRRLAGTRPAERIRRTNSIDILDQNCS
jgi:hypothetical protein